MTPQLSMLLLALAAVPIASAEPGKTDSAPIQQTESKLLAGSRLVITEAGWATVASKFGTRANEKKQARHFNDLLSWSKKMNITTFFFEAFDEDWKGDPANPLGAEKHWGLFTVDRNPKEVFRPK